MTDQLVNYGALGISLAACLVAIRILYSERNAESTARVEDAKAYAATLLTIQERILSAVDKLSELHDAARERDRRDRP